MKNRIHRDSKSGPLHYNPYLVTQRYTSMRKLKVEAVNIHGFFYKQLFYK